MQENEFEKQVRKQMEKFALVPNAEVWKEVEIKIRTEKRRRLLFYWLFAGLLLTGSAGTFLFFYNKNHSQLTNLSSDKKPGDVRSAKKLVIEKEKSVAEKALIKENAKARTKMLPQVAAAEKIKSFGYKKTSFSKITPKQDKQIAQAKEQISKALNKTNKNLAHYKSGDSNSVKSTFTKPRMEGRIALPPHKYLLSQQGQKLQQDTRQKTASSEQTTRINDSSVLESKDIFMKKNNSKNMLAKWQFGFTLYGGVSDNVTGIGLPLDKSLIAGRSSSLSSQSSPSAFSLPSASVLQYKSSVSFSAGVYVQKDVTKKLSVSAGVDYHSFSTTSKVGNKIDSTLNIYDSVLQIPTIVQPFYRSGQTTSYTNKYHLIQLPVNLLFQFNKSIKHPILFSFGLSPSFLIASDALYLNNNAGAYYQEENQFERFLLFGHSGLLYTLINRPAYNLSIGPTLQYDFTSFSKAATQTKQHLIFTGIKTNITFK